MHPQEPTVELLVWAYQRGWFPMVEPQSGQLGWFSPDPRCIFPIDSFHVPRRLARVVRSHRFEIRTDSSFEQVMRECAASRPGRESSWIDERLISAYVGLHKAGAAHSLEAWYDGRLVGGIYGVKLGGAFFGESMFSRPERGGTDASKVCLVELVDVLRTRGFELFDVQYSNQHLEQFGCLELPRLVYLGRLARALHLRTSWPSTGPLKPAC